MSSGGEAQSKTIGFSQRNPSLKINALSNWAALGVNIAIGFLLTPFIIGHLGKMGYGVWTLVGSFIGYYGLLNLGVGSAITRYVARYAGQGDIEALNKTASSAMAMFCCTGLLAVAASFLIAAPLAGFFEIEPDYVDDFLHVVWIIGLATGLGFPSNVLRAVVCAHERFVVANCASIATACTRAGLIFYVLTSGVGLVGIALAVLGSQLVALIAHYLLYKFVTPSVSISLRYARLSALRTLIVYGGVTTVIVIANILRTNIASLVIGKCVNIEAVAVYGVAALIIRYITQVITSGMSVLTPRFSALDGAEERVKFRSLFLRSLSVSALLSFGMCMLAIIFGGRFIVLWVGEDFVEAIPILWILCCSYAFALAQNPGIGAMFALNKHHFYAIATIIEAILNLVLSIMLAYKYGILGVAIGAGVSMFAVKVFVMPIYVSRIIGIGLLTYLRQLAVPCALAVLIVGVSYFAGVPELLKNCSSFGFWTAGVVTALSWAAVLYVMTFVVTFPVCSQKRSQLANTK